MAAFFKVSFDAVTYFTHKYSNNLVVAPESSQHWSASRNTETKRASLPVNYCDAKEIQPAKTHYKISYNCTNAQILCLNRNRTEVVSTDTSVDC